MIDLERAVARAPPLALAPLTARLEAGTHALLGGNGDGPSMVLGLLAGSVRLRGGRLRVLGEPAGDPRARRLVAYVPLDAVLPEPFRVDEALLAASAVRGEPTRDPMERLEVLGIGALARRPCRSLTREEARAVALAEAVTSSAQVLLVDEPLASIDPRALGAVASALRARARAGACVVVATGATRDARLIADEVLTFERGTLVRRAPASDPLVLAGPRGARVRVVSEGAKRLAAALANEAGVHDVALEAGVLVAGGPDAVAIAAAVARVALLEGIVVEAIQPELLRDDELRAAIAGDVAGAYRAAYDRARGAGAPTTLGAPDSASALRAARSTPDGASALRAARSTPEEMP